MAEVAAAPQLVVSSDDLVFSRRPPDCYPLAEQPAQEGFLRGLPKRQLRRFSVAEVAAAPQLVVSSDDLVFSHRSPDCHPQAAREQPLQE